MPQEPTTLSLSRSFDPVMSLFQKIHPCDGGGLDLIGFEADFESDGTDGVFDPGLSIRFLLYFVLTFILVVTSRSVMLKPPQT